MHRRHLPFRGVYALTQRLLKEHGPARCACIHQVRGGEDPDRQDLSQRRILVRADRFLDAVFVLRTAAEPPRPGVDQQTSAVTHKVQELCFVWAGDALPRLIQYYQVYTIKTDLPLILFQVQLFDIPSFKPSVEPACPVKNATNKIFMPGMGRRVTRFAVRPPGVFRNITV